ncbi:MAG TPA: DUF302 domain-containing protein [Alphaproteobacteria bacterium]|nr:DUF302 domain-containing protein [Alphaproteobacteria bacterium]
MTTRPFLHALLIVAVLTLAARVAGALPPGLVTKRSPYDVTQTLDRLEDLLKKNGFTIEARVDDRAIAKKGGETIGAAETLSISKADFDAGLLKSERTIALDLPLRIVAWEDASGRVSLAYPDLDRLVQRYNITNQPVAVEHLAQLLDQLTDEAVKP